MELRTESDLQMVCMTDPKSIESKKHNISSVAISVLGSSSTCVMFPPNFMKAEARNQSVTI